MPDGRVLLYLSEEICLICLKIIYTEPCQIKTTNQIFTSSYFSNECCQLNVLFLLYNVCCTMTKLFFQRVLITLEQSKDHPSFPTPLLYLWFQVKVISYFGQHPEQCKLFTKVLSIMHLLLAPKRK